MDDILLDDVLPDDVLPDGDPMHGNTVTAPDGRKTRFVGAVAREVTAFGARCGKRAACTWRPHRTTCTSA